MKTIKYTHLLFGIGGVVLFLLTGQYMHRSIGPLAELPVLSRALVRAGHIYILISSIVHAMIGIYFRLSTNKSILTLQIVGSILLYVSYIFLVFSFFNELPSENIERPNARIGLYLLLAGGMSHGAYLFDTKKIK